MTVSPPSGRSLPVARVGVMARPHLAAAATTLDALIAWLTERGVAVVCDEETAPLLTGAPRSLGLARRDELPALVDLVVVLGGDGTFLHAAVQIAQARADVPLLGVNFGSLGFLTEVTLAEVYASLEAAIEGRARIDRRMMLRGEVCESERRLHDLVALNDVVITRGARTRIIDLSVSVDDQFVARFKADGLIVASPTGSTAYNLAAGGPIVHPGMHALVLTPIAPHTLTNRPIVIPASARVSVRLSSDDEAEIVVTFDGQTAIPIGSAHHVVVTEAPAALRVVRSSTRSYFEVLRQKLKWTER
ncbi:MAG: NAD(+)/NADH kinase [Vicinamibacterales bacterium]